MAEADLPGAAGPASFLLTDLTALVTPAAPPPLRGSDLGRVEVIAPAALAVRDGVIAAAGPPAELARFEAHLPVVSGEGLVALPGLVDCHTHPAFGGDRAAEFELRAQGADYETIHAAGGGILATVAATRALGPEGLCEAVRRHTGWMAAHGTTTAECKSGYGLDGPTELASLAAICERHPIETVPTFLGAHAVPPEFESADSYLDHVIAEVLPAAAVLAEAADVFVERGAFNADQAGRYLRAAIDHGLTARMHGDQFTESGAIPLAVELGARSVDHLEQTGPEGVRLLAGSDVCGVLLPIAAMELRRPMPPARALIDAGAIVALATDFNPGSAFCESLPVAMHLACVAMGMTPAEALSACTANAAWVLHRGERIGRLAEGLDADLLLLRAPDWRHLVYHFGGPAPAAVLKRGRRVE